MLGFGVAGSEFGVWGCGFQHIRKKGHTYSKTEAPHHRCIGRRVCEGFDEEESQLESKEKGSESGIRTLAEWRPHIFKLQKTEHKHQSLRYLIFQALPRVPPTPTCILTNPMNDQPPSVWT